MYLKVWKRATLENFVDSPTRRVGESFFDYEYLSEFEVKIETARKLVEETHEKPIYAKKPQKIRFIAMSF